MEIEVRELEDTRFQAIVEDARPSQVNALRRTLVGDIPTLAVEDVTVYDNTSALFDEVIAHRLGMVPIPTEPDTYNFRDECTCGGEGCPNCSVIYTLSKEGPATVYSGDLIPQDESLELPDEEIPIVTLLEGQRLMLEAVAHLGSGEDHVKWSPAVAPAFHEMPRIVHVENGREEIEVEQLCSAHIAFRGEAEGVEEVAESSCDLCNQDVDDNELKVVGEKGRYVFRFETDGSMTAREAMKQAIQTVRGRLKDLESRLEGLD